MCDHRESLKMSGSTQRPMIENMEKLNIDPLLGDTLGFTNIFAGLGQQICPPQPDFTLNHVCLRQVLPYILSDK